MNVSDERRIYAAADEERWRWVSWDGATRIHILDREARGDSTLCGMRMKRVVDWAPVSLPLAAHTCRNCTKIFATQMNDGAARWH